MIRPATLVRLQCAILVMLAVFAAAYVGSAWDELPPRIASHFNASGRPDGFMSRGAFFLRLAAAGGGTVSLLLLVPVLLRVVPSGTIRLPHRDYWLAPERRDQTLQRIASWFGWYAIATAALLVLVAALTLRANVARTGLEISVSHIGLGLYVATMLGLSVGLFRQFGRPPSRG